jgi:hypothetical protein
LNKDKVISVDFSAWRYEKEEHLIIPLLDTIREALVVLPPVSRQSLDDFLTSIYQEANLPEAQKKDLQKPVAPHLPFIVTESGVNPREVKRYINSYILQMKINIDRKLDPRVILEVTSLKSEFLSLTSRVETVLSGSNHRRKVKDDLSAITAFLDELISALRPWIVKKCPLVIKIVSTRTYHVRPI